MTADRVQLLVRLGYDGRRFYGVTPQPERATVHDALAARIRGALGDRPRALTFAARTDRGVHARANLATCWLPPGTDAPPARLRQVEEDRDDGLVGVTVRRVAPSTYARSLSIGKRYRYAIEAGWLAEREHAHAWRIWPRLDTARMQEAAAHLVGTHDFRALATRHPPQKPSVRTLSRVEVVPPPDLAVQHPRWTVWVEGDGFLRRMVRTLVGTLAECGVGLRDPEDLPALLEARDRERAGLCAPAGGLLLDEVFTAAG